MIQLIDKLEKSKSFWFLLIVFLVFFLLRLPSVIEPDWYGDEGIYQVVGMAINNGHILYSEIWDNKPPLLYLTYALFQGDHFTMRFFSLIIGLLTTGLFFALSQLMFKNLKASIVTTLLFTILFATPLIEGNIANAENFMLLPIILAALIIYKTTNEKNHRPFALRPLLFAGFLLGIAFLFKIVAIFDLAAFLCFLLIIGLPKKLTLFRISLLRDSCFMILGFIIPLLITILYFVLHNALPDFIRATFSGMFGYVGYGNTFFIPQGFLIVKLLLLTGIIGLLTITRTKLSQPTLFIFLWLSFSLFNAFFSGRPYIHYMLVLLPSFCLFVGLILSTRTRKRQLQLSLLLLLVITTIFISFKTYGVKKMLLYYQNAYLFVIGQKDVSSYQTFFDRKTPRDYQLASYIKMHTKPGDPLLIWGDNPQIYALSKTLPITKYTVAYHTRQDKDGFVTTQKAINTIQPKYIIMLSEAPNFPFYLSGYSQKFSLERATIYEKSF